MERSNHHALMHPQPPSNIFCCSKILPYQLSTVADTACHTLPIKPMVSKMYTNSNYTEVQICIPGLTAAAGFKRSKNGHSSKSTAPHFSPLRYCPLLSTIIASISAITLERADSISGELSPPRYLNQLDRNWIKTKTYLLFIRFFLFLLFLMYKYTQLHCTLLLKSLSRILWQAFLKGSEGHSLTSSNTSSR